MMPGVPERRSHDYTRHGTTDLFAAFNISSEQVPHPLGAGCRSRASAAAAGVAWL
jgi:hypothetical protein